jgi:hypothetical protein
MFKGVKRKGKRGPVLIPFLAFYPKLELVNLAGLLTCSLFDAFPLPGGCSGLYSKSYKELTAAGTVPDFHRIPF